MFSDLFGKPFQSKGRGPDGYDCLGLVREIRRRVGRETPDFDISALAFRDIDAAFQIEEQSSRWVKLQEPEPFCVVPIRNHPKYVNHMGVVIPGGLFMHIEKDQTVKAERLGSILVVKRIVGFYELAV